MTRPTIYLYAIAWADVRPGRTVERAPLIAGGMHNAREARRFFAAALAGSPDWQRRNKVRGVAVIRRVTRIGPDTPAAREAIG